MAVKFSLIETHLINGLRNEMLAPETPDIEAENRKMVVPGFCVLVQHDSLGNILYDTGISNDWQRTWNDHYKRIYSLQANYDLAEKLAEFGLEPKDIDLLILSHLHYDHAGNLYQFSGTKAGQSVLISEAEAREAFVAVNLNDRGWSGAYLKNEFEGLPGIGYQLLQEDSALADDIELFIQPGHTPGVIGMVLHTQHHGSFIFPSDAVYMAQNYGPPVHLPGICSDPDAFRANIRRLEAMKEQYNAQIIFGHDYNDYQKSPYWYD